MRICILFLLVILIGSTVSALIVTLFALTIPVEADEIDYAGYRPHYQGPGTATIGGRGGTVRRVTKLTDDGSTGTLRWALTTEGARFVVFEVSGTIVLDSLLTVDQPYATIAGQTAPSPGITIRSQCGFRIETHDVVVQHLRIRRGDYTGCSSSSTDGIWLRNGVSSVVLDHLTVSWGSDELIGVNAASGPGPKGLSVLDSILSEGLMRSAAAPTSLAKGSLLGANPAGTATFARNLFAHNYERNVATAPGWRLTYVNNLTYNTGAANNANGPYLSSFNSGSSCTPMPGYENTINEIVAIGNVAIAGLDSTGTAKPLSVIGAATGTQIYLENNLGYGITSATGNGQWAGAFINCTNTSTGSTLTEAMVRANAIPKWFTDAFSGKQLLATVGNVARDYVLACAGARPSDRDSIDTRVAASVRAGTGRIISSQNDVGGYSAAAAVVKTQAWTDAASPNVIATSGISANGVRTNREVKLEDEAQALENPAACGWGTLPSTVDSSPNAPTRLRIVP